MRPVGMKHPQWKVATPIGREWKRKANAFLSVSRFSIPDQFTSEPQPHLSHSHVRAATAPEPQPHPSRNRFRLAATSKQQPHPSCYLSAATLVILKE